MPTDQVWAQSFSLDDVLFWIEHEPAFGVGVDHLRCHSVKVADDVPGVDGFGAGHIVCGRDNGNHIDCGFFLPDCLHGGHYSSSSAHIILHFFHSSTGLQADSS